MEEYDECFKTKEWMTSDEDEEHLTSLIIVLSSRSEQECAASLLHPPFHHFRTECQLLFVCTEPGKGILDGSHAGLPKRESTRRKASNRGQALSREPG